MKVFELGELETNLVTCGFLIIFVVSDSECIQLAIVSLSNA